MKINYYELLPDFSVAPVTDMEEAGRLANTSHKLFVTTIGSITVSTVFLCIDHAWGDRVAPILFETMVFTYSGCGSAYDGRQDRYTTYEEAKAGHKALVKEIRASMRP